MRTRKKDVHERLELNHEREKKDNRVEMTEHDNLKSRGGKNYCKERRSEYKSPEEKKSYFTKERRTRGNKMVYERINERKEGKDEKRKGKKK